MCTTRTDWERTRYRWRRSGDYTVGVGRGAAGKEYDITVTKKKSKKGRTMNIVSLRPGARKTPLP